MSNTFIPYSTQTISQKDIDAVTDVLKSGWLTSGNTVGRFEQAVANYCGVKYGIALSNGTAALHAAIRALDLRPGDEVIVPAMSFVATANAVLYENCVPVFCDVMENTLLINPDCLEELITPKTRAVIAVDYGGQPCDYDKLRSISQNHGLYLIADSCHALGGEYNRRKCGSLADMTVFSFHPVKLITSGEGGMVMTDSAVFLEKIKRFRNHDISASADLREKKQSYRYDIDSLGYNYRLSDIHSALGLSQLSRLDEWVEKRHRLASIYKDSFKDHPRIKPLLTEPYAKNAFHLYVVKVPQRDGVFRAMRRINIGVNVHYLPIYLHNYYRKTRNTSTGLCPVSEKCYSSILSLPLFPDLPEKDQLFVIENLINIVESL